MPSAVIGEFESEFLNLPTEVITTVMVHHQRYFPIFQDSNQQKLLPILSLFLMVTQQNQISLLLVMPE